jgi:hypothetical protein
MEAGCSGPRQRPPSSREPPRKRPARVAAGSLQGVRSLRSSSPLARGSARRAAPR